MKAKVLFIYIMLLTFEFFVSNCYSQNLTSASANGSSVTTSTSFVGVTGASVSISASAGKKVLVVATFSGISTADTDATYRLVDDEAHASGEIMSTNNGSYAIGSVVHVFTITSSGTRNYSIQHKTTGLALTTEATITAIELYDGANVLPSIVATSTGSVQLPTDVFNTALESSVLTTTATGGFYISASVQSAKTSGGSNVVVGEWVLQYKKSISGTWTNVSYPLTRSTSGQDKGIVNMVGALPDNTEAGDYYFRVAHRKVSGAAQVETQACNMVAVALSTSSGFFPVMIASKLSSINSSTSFTDVVAAEVIPQATTGLFLHSQYNLKANATLNFPMYDLYAKQGATIVFDGADHKRYLSGSSDRGSGTTAGLISGLTSGTEYDVSLRHASVNGTTLTTENSYLIGFGLNRSSLPFVLPVTVNATQGQISSSYNTLKAAFDDINSGIFRGDISVLVNRSTTETASVILNASGSGSASYTSVNIYPTVAGISISGSLNASLIELNGADNVTFDGRVNQTGDANMLISNTNTSSSARTILFTNDATSNTIKYCVVKGSSTNSSDAAIYFGTSTLSTGNDNNTIDNCSITNAGTRPLNGIYSVGTNGKNNSGITISNNKFYDLFSTTANSNALNIGSNNSSWTISGNSFYETATLVPTGAFTYTAININYSSGTGFNVTDNYIGGSSSQCGGGAFNISAATSHLYQAIYLAVSSSSSVQNNTIRNFSVSGTNTSPWYGIYVAMGSVNIGTITGNTIGATTGTGSVTVNGQANNTILYGIYIATTGTVGCNNNSVGSITASNTNSTNATSFYGIYKSVGSGTTQIDNNTIGSVTESNSVNTSSLSTATGQYLTGIYSAGTGSVTISNNTIANLSNASTLFDSQATIKVIGIHTVSGSNAISNNSIHHLSAVNYIAGISQQSTSASQTITLNTIHDLTCTSLTQNSRISAVYYSGPTSGTNAINRNFIHSLDIASSDIASCVHGIDLYAGALSCTNNIINLGVSNTRNYEIVGIWEIGISLQINSVYFNTIYIGGSPSATTANTYAYFKNSNSGTTNLRNNLFVNQRSGGTTGKHYAIGLPGLSGITIDYNDYYVSGTGGVLGRLTGADKTTLPLWKNGTTQDLNSINIIPGFTLAGGTSFLNYYTSASLPGITGTGTTIDYVGVTRGATPKMGALEINNFTWQGGTSTSFGVASNWAEGVVPPDGADITFAANPTRSCLLDQDRTLGSITNAQSTYKFDLNRNQLSITKNLVFSNGAQLDASAVSSTLVFSGTSAQEIPAGSLVGNTIYALTVDNSYGLSMNNDLTITQTLSLTNGAFNIGAYTLTLNGAVTTTLGSLNGGSTSSISVGGSSSSNTTLPGVVLNHLTLNRTLGLTLGGNVTIGGILTLTDGDLTLGANTLTLSGNTPVRTSGSINASHASSTLIFGNTDAFVLPVSIFSTAVTNLTISGTGGITVPTDLTVNGVLNLASANASGTKGCMDMLDGVTRKTLTMGASATTIGTGDVTGIIKRTTFVLGTSYSFGNQFSTMTLTVAGDLPTEVSLTVILTDAEPAWMTTSTGIFRTYEIRQVGCNATTRLNLKLHYLDSELNGNTEGTLDLFDYHVTDNLVHDHGHSNYEINENWVALANLGLYFLSSTDANTHYWTMGASITSNMSIWMGGSLSGPTDWNLPGNWTGTVPTSISNVVIPDVSNDPVVPSDISISSLKIEFGGAVNNPGGYTITLNGADAAWANLGTYTAGSSTVVFVNSNATLSGTTNFNNLTVNNGAELTLGTNAVVRIAGILSLSSTGILNATFSDNTIEYNGTSQTVINPNGTINGYHDLILSGSGTKTLPATALSISGDLNLKGSVATTANSILTIGGSLTLDAGTSFTSGNYNHSVGGNIDNSGTFTISAGNSMTMNGSGAQSILGTIAISFYNLIISNSAGVSIFNDAIINNLLTLTSGIFKIGDVLLTLNGGISKTAGFIEVGVLSSLAIGESAALSFSSNLFSTTPIINNLSINRLGGVTLGNQDIRVNGLLNLIAGVFTIGGNKLTLAGSPPIRTSGSIDASNSNASIELSCTSAVVLPTTIFNGAINNLTINTPAGVSTMSDLTVNGVLDLQSANPTSTKGSLDMWDGVSMRTLTLGAGNSCIGTGDVTGLITHQSITYGVVYSFGHPHTTAYFSNDGILPTQISVKIRIGVEPTWKVGAIKREVEVIHNGGSGTKAIFSCHYLDSELNGNDETTLSFWMQLDPSSFEYGRSTNNTAENWVLLSSANLSFFPTSWDANRKITLGKYNDIETLIWNGSISDSWTSVQNWTPSTGNPPTVGPAAIRNIIIPDVSTTPYSPTLPAITEVKTITLSSAAVLNAVAGAQLTLNGASAWINEGGTFNANTSNVIFTNTDATVTGTTDFYNITTSTDKTLWLVNGCTIRIGGAITNNGTIRTVSNGSTVVEYNGTGPQTVVIPYLSTSRYSTLILSGSGVKTLPNSSLHIEQEFILSGTATVNAQAAISIDGNVSIGAGTVLNTANYSHTLVGNIENNGTLTATSSGTTTFAGAATQTISGTGTTNFYNLTINNTSSGSVELNSTIGAANLIINNGCSLSINPLASMNVSTAISNNAGAPGLQIKCSETAANGSLIFAGTPPLATVEMFSKANWNLTNPIGARYKWQFFGIPLSSQIASPLFDGAYVRLHSEAGVSSNWTQLNNSSVLSPFNGYEITQELPKTYSFQGTLVNSNLDERILATTTGARSPGQHIFSNPYTAAIDITQLTFGTETEASVYLYNTGSQQDWKDNSGTADGTSPGQYTVAPKATAGTGGIPGQIPSMQGFMVVTKSSSALSTFSIPYTSVVVKNADKQRSPSINKNAQSEKAFTRIDLIGSRFADRMWMFSEASCTHGYDNGWDGYKMMGSGLTPQLFAMEAAGDFQVNSVDNFNNTELGFKAGEDSVYTMRFTNEKLETIYSEIYLVDLLENTTTDITETGTEYTFKAKATAEPVKRFKIVTELTHPTSVINSIISENELKVYHSNDLIFVDNKSSLPGDLLLCDVAGLIFRKVHFEANGLTTIPVSLAAGTYIAKASTLKGQALKKLIIR